MNSVEISGFIPKLGLVVVGIVLVECTRQGLNYLLQRKNSKPVIRQVIFFPDKQIACKDFSIQSKAVRGFAAISATQQLASGWTYTVGT